MKYGVLRFIQFQKNLLVEEMIKRSKFGEENKNVIYIICIPIVLHTAIIVDFYIEKFKKFLSYN